MKSKFLLLVSFFTFLFAQQITVNLSSLYPTKNILRGSYDAVSLSVPIANRWNIKNLTLHLEFMPSKALVPKRSELAVFFNNVVVYQKVLNPKIDIYTADIKIPVSLVKDFNKLKVIAIQHYCVNCCENPASPELWTQILWKKSYINVNYNEKPVSNNLLYLREYVLDSKNLGKLHYGIFTQTDDDTYLTMGAKIASYLGANIKYRTIYIDKVNSLKQNEDIFLIGTNAFVSKTLNLPVNIKLPNVFLVKNPYYPSKAVIIITAPNEDKLKRIVNSLISLPRNLIMGKHLSVVNYKPPQIGAYESPLYVPFDKRVYLADLGYKDLKFYKPSNTQSIKFTVPPDLFTFAHDTWVFHIYYNYNGAVNTKASAINLFLNGKFIGALKVKKEYGVLLKDKKIKIPVYLLSPGENTITIQYALKAPGGGHCISPNYKLLQGTVFTKKSYIEIPNLLHWREMPYMQLFTTQIYPFSIYPDLKETQIFLAEKTDNVISALYTLMAYEGEKTLVPAYNVEVISSSTQINPNSNIIGLGSIFPKSFFENMPIIFDGNFIKLKFNAFKRIENTLKNRLLGYKESKNLKILLALQDKLFNETLWVEGESPFKDQRTILLIMSRNDNNILQSVRKLYDPVFSGKIKGDVSIIDVKNNKVYSADIGKKYYVGHLPWLNYILFKIGFSLPTLLILFVLTIFIIVIVLKLLLDLRERRKKE